MTRKFRRLTLSGAATLATTLMFVASAHATVTPTTGAASSVLTVSATLNGIIATDGSATVWEFQYGTTTDYGQTSASQVIPAGAPAAVAVPADVTGLQPDKTYHYRLVTTTGAGTAYYPLVVAYGSDQTFTTDKAGTAAFAFPGAVAGSVPQLALTGGVIPLPALSCASIDACTGSVTVTSLVRIDARAVSGHGRRARYRKIVLANQKFAIPAGKSRKIHPRVSRSGRRLLKSSHGTRTVTLSVRFATGQKPIKQVLRLTTK